MQQVPRHIGIILDGNRRFAKRLMLKPWMGHEWGAKKIEQLLGWAHELGVHELTLYAFSVQNFNRPKQEFDYLMDLFGKEFDRLMNEELPEIKKNGIRLVFIGRLHMFPSDLQDKMARLMELTKGNSLHVVNFAMAYGGREEVVDAVRRLAARVQSGALSVNEINEEVFGRELYLNSSPDLIIRTGGDKRTSNFLPWQAVYSEWVFLEKTWPEFEKQDLVNAVTDFQQRERRFGK